MNKIFMRTSHVEEWDESQEEKIVLLHNLFLECKRFLTSVTRGCTLVRLEESLRDGNVPSGDLFDDLFEEMCEVCRYQEQKRDNIYYTTAFIAQYILYDILGQENSQQPELGAYIDHDIFHIEDENEGYAHYMDKIDLRYLDV
jgi:hypothetical protein